RGASTGAGLRTARVGASDRRLALAANELRGGTMLCSLAFRVSSTQCDSTHCSTSRADTEGLRAKPIANMLTGELTRCKWAYTAHEKGRHSRAQRASFQLNYGEE